MQATLALEDGRVFRGKGYGAKGECYGEVVFNTSITGYQEIFTDPSYCGQIVVLTNPEIGNYGTNAEDNEATRPYIEGLIVREFSRVSSNWRSQQVAEEYLEQFKIPVLAEIDSRALVRHLRDHGVMRGVVSTLENDADKLVAKARSIPKMDGTDLAKVVSTKSTYVWETGRAIASAGRSGRCERRAGAISCGGLRLRDQAEHSAQAARRGLQGHGGAGADSGGRCSRAEAGWRVSVERSRRSGAVHLRGGQHSPPHGTAADFRDLPGTSTHRHRAGRENFQAEVWTPRREPSGKAVDSGKIEITAHNHNFAVDPDSLPQSEVELTHIDLNDNTLEGMRHRNLPLFSVQYHPGGVAGAA